MLACDRIKGVQWPFVHALGVLIGDAKEAPRRRRGRRGEIFEVMQASAPDPRMLSRLREFL